MATVPSIGRAEPETSLRLVPDAAEATHDLYERYGSQIYRFCLRELGNREEAEDAAQTTFLNAFRGLDRGVAPEFESAWLYTIASRVCISRKRSSYRRGRVEATDDLDVVQELVPSHPADADELFGLRDALEGLPEQQRRALLLREWQGLSCKEIATELELSPSAVEMLLFRARRGIVEELTAETPAPRRGLRNRLRTSGDMGSMIAAIKTLFFAGGTKIVATLATVAASTVVAATPATRHEILDFVAPPAPKPAPVKKAVRHPMPARIVVATPAHAPSPSRVAVTAAAARARVVAKTARRLHHATRAIVVPSAPPARSDVRTAPRAAAPTPTAAASAPAASVTPVVPAASAPSPPPAAAPDDSGAAPADPTATAAPAPAATTAPPAPVTPAPQPATGAAAPATAVPAVQKQQAMTPAQGATPAPAPAKTRGAYGETKNPVAVTPPATVAPSPTPTTTTTSTTTTTGAVPPPTAPPAVPATLTITGFQPASGAVGTWVTIAGAQLGDARSVSFNGVAASFSAGSDSQLTARVPSGATSGPVTVTTKKGSVTSSAGFTIAVPAPSIGALSPAAGSPGTWVTIGGSGLSGTSAVSFNGVAATFSVTSDSQLGVRVPDGATTGPVTVTTPAGTTTSAASFSVAAPPPSVDSFAPATAPAGSTVTISGAHLTGATAVSFDGVAASGFAVVSDSQLTAQVPTSATSGAIRVTTASGTAVTAGVFTVTAPPTLTDVSPPAGRAGSSIAIGGTQLSGATSVTFNGVAATFTVASDSEIYAQVPASATSGPIVVTTPAGSVTSASSFNVAGGGGGRNR